MNEGRITESPLWSDPRGQVMKTPDDVAEMLRLKACGWGLKRIARELGCSHHTVKAYVAAGGVKLCLSGHVHLNDRVEMGVPGAPADGAKVTYICDGAVCGSWWDGRKAQCDEGYGVVDLYDDGTFEHRYVAYGWKA